MRLRGLEGLFDGPVRVFLRGTLILLLGILFVQIGGREHWLM